MKELESGGSFRVVKWDDWESVLVETILIMGNYLFLFLYFF